MEKWQNNTTSCLNCFCSWKLFYTVENCPGCILSFNDTFKWSRHYCVQWTVEKYLGCKSDCLVNSAESSLRGIHSSVPCPNSVEHKTLSFGWQNNGLNRNSFSCRIMLMSSWQKVGLHLMNAGQSNNNFLSSLNLPLRDVDSSDSCKKTEICPLNDVNKLDKEKQSSFYNRVLHPVFGLFLRLKL